MSFSSTDRFDTILNEIAKDLGYDNPRFTVNKAQLLGENCYGDIFQATINQEKNDGTTESVHLIVKAAPQLAKLRVGNFIQGFYQTEVYFYRNILPMLNEHQRCLSEEERFEYSKPYKTSLKEGEEIIVLEDLGKRGFRMLDRMKPFTYEQLVLCIKNAARFHAASFVLKTKQPKVYQEIYKATYTYEMMRSDFRMFLKLHSQAAIPLVENEPYKTKIEHLIENTADDFLELFENDIEDPHSVLIHGDAWNNNLLFHEEDGKSDKMAFVDWQQMRNASPIVDLSYFLLLCIDSKLRRKHYEEMLDLYYQVFSSNVTKMGVDIDKHFPASVYRKQVTKYMKFGVIVGFGVLPLTLANKKVSSERSKVFDTFSGDGAPTVVPPSKTCKIRMKEIFEDCVELNII